MFDHTSLPTSSCSISHFASARAKASASARWGASRLNDLEPSNGSDHSRRTPHLDQHFTPEISLLRTLLGGGEKATRNKCIASSNKCLTSSNKKLLGTSALLVVKHGKVSARKMCLAGRVFRFAVSLSGCPFPGLRSLATQGRAFSSGSWTSSTHAFVVCSFCHLSTKPSLLADSLEAIALRLEAIAFFEFLLELSMSPSDDPKGLPPIPRATSSECYQTAHYQVTTSTSISAQGTNP